MSNTDLRSPAAEAANLRRQIRELQARINETRRAGNGERPELQARITNLMTEIASRFGADQMPYVYASRCAGTGTRPLGAVEHKVARLSHRYTTRCVDCGRIVNVIMPRVNGTVKIGAH